MLNDQRDNLADALDKFGKFSALAADSVNQTKDSLVQELKDLGPVLESLANAGPALTRSLSLLSTFPWAKETITNGSAVTTRTSPLVVDLTLSRLDNGVVHRNTVGRRSHRTGDAVGPNDRSDPQPYTAGNPLIDPVPPRPGTVTCDLSRRIKIQLVIFAVIALAARGRHVFGYIGCPHTVRHRALHRDRRVARRPAGSIRAATSPTAGTEVGRVEDVHLTDTGVEAVLALQSDVGDPVRSDAEVHSVTAIGEQYVAADAAQRQRPRRCKRR